MEQTVFRTAVPIRVGKDLVHKHDAEQVLLTDLERIGADEFLIRADWGEAGRLIPSGDGVQGHAVLLTETIRQTFPLLCHAGYDVPFGDRLVWDEYRCAFGLAALRSGEGRPELRIACHDLIRRRDRLAGLSLDITVERDGERLANAHTRFTVQAPAVYRRLRGPHRDVSEAMAAARRLPLPPPVSGGSEEFRDAVLSPTDDPSRWQLRIDPHHPVYFDHPADHAPGILLLEAAQQAARILRHPRAGVTETMETRFHRYIELDSPCWVQARPLPDDQQGRARLLVTMDQDGELCFTALVSVADAQGD
ncbi:ScbA/BarX family gamma-butyrolactone biosynthesis protein [Streptacidiphilus pinicola]|nr:ScbA/BarX family gamma-butyrolactone biosynthesis protein [Streptacidiphilus pinicola]